MVGDMYEPSRCIATFDISGFQYWDGALVLDRLKPGYSVQLRKEPDNPHDPNAIAIFFEATKLGYVPANQNEMLATMLFYGHKDIFEARVIMVDREAAPWNQVRVGLYVSDRRNAA